MRGHSRRKCIYCLSIKTYHSMKRILNLTFGIFSHHLLNCLEIGPHISTALYLLCCCLKMPLTLLTYLGFGNESLIDYMSAQAHSSMHWPVSDFLIINSSLSLYDVEYLRFEQILIIWLTWMSKQNETQILFFIMGKQEMTLLNVMLAYWILSN